MKILLTVLVIIVSIGMVGCDNPEDNFNKGVKAEQVKDYGKAVNLYRKAAEQGLSKAQHKLATMYYKGKGVIKDYAKADKWYRKSTE